MNQSEKNNLCDLCAGIDDMVFICDREGKIIYFNNSINVKLGYSNQELTGKHILEFYPKKQRKEAKKIFVDIFAKKRNSCSLCLQAKSGKLISIEIKTCLGRWEDRECVFGVAKDFYKEGGLQKYNMLFTGNPVPMAIIELSSRKFTEVNTAFLSKLQYKEPDIIGKTIADLGLFNGWEKQKKTVDVLEKKGYMRNLDFKIRANTGVILNGIFSGEVFESQGKKFFLIVITDFTEYRQAEKKIRKNLEQQKILAEILIKLNQSKNFQRTINDLLKKIAFHTNAGRAYIFENNPYKKTASNTFEWRSDSIKPQINNLQNIPFEKIIFFKKLKKEGIFLSNDVSKLPLDVRSKLETQNIKSILVLQLIVKNKFFGFIGFNQIVNKKEWQIPEIIMLKTIASSISNVYEKKQNIKEIKSKTEQISREKSKIETIIQSIGDGVFVVDNNSRIMLINPVASQLSGYSEKEALNKKYSKILRFVLESDPKKENSDFIIQAMATGKAQSMPRHTMLISKQGKTIPVADSAVPLKNKRSKIIGCVVVFRDATREREIDRMKSEFVSLASHQLKTPMTGIKWMSELMLRGHLSDKQKEYMNDIHESTNRTIGLVDDLLNLSRMETGGQFNIVKKRTDLDKIFKEIIENNREFAEFKKVAIKYKKNLPKPMLNIDCDKIKYALNNIFNNSIKYSRGNNGKVFVDIRKKDNKILIKIKDNGIGIPAVQQKKIFEKFFRADNAQSDTIGTGLGLSIAKFIIEAHGGQIWFESKKDNGTIFYVGLPLK